MLQKLLPPILLRAVISVNDTTHREQNNLILRLSALFNSYYIHKVCVAKRVGKKESKKRELCERKTIFRVSRVIRYEMKRKANDEKRSKKKQTASSKRSRRKWNEQKSCLIQDLGHHCHIYNLHTLSGSEKIIRKQFNTPIPIQCAIITSHFIHYYILYYIFESTKHGTWKQTNIPMHNNNAIIIIK